MNDKFFPELTRRLHREGITTDEAADGFLPVLVAERRVMRIDQEGMILLAPDTMDEPEVKRTYDAAAKVTAEVREYTTAMAAAPPLKAKGLHEGFLLLSEFNGILLAGRELPQDMGYEFVTWRRDGAGTGVCNGNYYHNGYEGAKQDFACRSALADQHRLFTDEQLAEMYRCIHETLDGESPITKERRNILTSAAEQIKRAVDDLDERVEQSSQRELEAADGHESANSPGLEMSP